jgi:hypothetical protein
MIALNLNAARPEEIIIKDYLENNVSDTLAEKINNGVKIEKDGKTLINKKTFVTFMDYACEEARKQADKGAKFACVGNDTVFSWAVHYFEENSIYGTLYNEDGTEYKVIKPTETKPQVKSISLFDLMDDQKLESYSTEEEMTETMEIEDEDLEAPELYDEPIPNEIVQSEPIPSFLINLFGDTLKVEVSR